jgi:hypothetical protein
MSDRKFFWIVSYAVLLLTLIPHAAGWLRVVRGDFAAYQAYSSLAPGDTNVYFSYMEQARQGALAFENLFTGELQKPTILHPLWLIGGRLSAAVQLSIPAAFQLLRVVSSAFFLWAVFRFLGWLGLSSRERRWAFLVVALGSGIGFAFAPWVNFDLTKTFFSTDLWVSESNTFTTLMHSAPFPLSQALLLLIFQSFLTHWRDSRTHSLLPTGGLLLLLSFIHTYDLLTVSAVLMAYGIVLLLRNEISNPSELLRYIRRGMLLIPFTVPAALYFWFVLGKEPAVSGWLSQNITRSPNFLAYLAGFGLLIPLALIGVRSVLRARRERLVFAITWLVTSAVLIYLPHLTLQRRLANGMHIPLAALAGIGIFWLMNYLRSRSRSLVAPVIALISLILVATPLTLIARDAVYTLSQGGDNHPYFLSSDEVAAQSYLLQNLGSRDVVYAHPWTGNELAGLGIRVFIGHIHQTVRWAEKRKALDDFFTEWTEADRKQYVAQNGITWIYYGPRERALGSWNPALSPWLEAQLHSGDITLYKVRALPLAS